MKRGEPPLSFVMNLAQNDAARKKFQSMTDEEKENLINKTYDIHSRDEMRSFVNGLTDIPPQQ